MFLFKMKRTVREIRILFILALSIIVLADATASTPYADSLRRSLSEAKEGEYYMTLIRLYDHYYYMNIDSSLHYLNLLQQYNMESKEKIQSDLTRAQGHHFYEQKMWDTLFEHAPYAIEFINSHELNFNLLNVYYMLSSVSKNMGRVDEAMKQAALLYEKAKSINDYELLCLSCMVFTRLYYGLGSYDDVSYFVDEGLGYISILLAQDTENSKPLNVIHKAALLTRTALAIGEYEKVARKSEQFLNHIDSIHGNAPEWAKPGYELFCAEFAMLASEAYIALGNLEKAQEYIETADLYFDKDLTGFHKMKYYDTYYKYFLALKDYKKALEYLEVLLSITDTANMEQVISLNHTKAQLLYDLEDYQQAALLFESSRKLRDSVEMAKFAEQLENLNAKNKAIEEKKEALEQSNYSQKMHFRWLGSLGVILTLSIILTFIWRHSKKNNKKNMLLIEQINRISVLNAKLYALRKAIAENTVVTEDVSLFSRLEQLMREEKLYLNPGITREEVAKKLLTNDLYLRDAIRQETGLSFGNYITMLRLEHSRVLLTTSKKSDISISQVAYISGFNTLRNYSRLFKEHYGMTPGELRR